LAIGRVVTVPTPGRVVIATRESRLALWQAEHVRALLVDAHPGLEVVIDGMTTQGDRILDKTLSKVGGKGLFVKELEAALANGSADLAVHSLKDVPMTLPDGFALAAILPREDATDAFVSNRYATPDELPPEAVVGTSSLRREAQFRALHPHVVVRSVRGNVGTRLDKLDRGDFDALLLASAGLLRLGLGDRIGTRLDATIFVPSPGQGALGIEIGTDRDDLRALLAPLADRDTTFAAMAERAVSRTLGGNCTMPLGAYATWAAGGRLDLRAVLGKPDGTLLLRATASAIVEDLREADALGRDAGRQLIAQGGLALVPGE
jgi:hydroxymethylbilane synthase